MPLSTVPMTTKQINKLPEFIQIDGDLESREVYIDGNFLDARPSIKLFNHSPDGFNWGYGGSGPAQLALALLLKFLTQEQALRYYQSFKFKYVGAWPQSNFDIKFPFRESIRSIVNKTSENAQAQTGNLQPENK